MGPGAVIGARCAGGLRPLDAALWFSIVSLHVWPPGIHVLPGGTPWPQVSTLQTQAKIEPGFTQLVWQKLEEQVRGDGEG